MKIVMMAAGAALLATPVLAALRCLSTSFSRDISRINYCIEATSVSKAKAP